MNTRNPFLSGFPQKFPTHIHTLFCMLPSVFILSSGNGFHAEHCKSLIDFIHSYGFFALFKFANKAKSKAGMEGKLLLSKSGFFSFLFNKFSDSVYNRILHPIGYNVNELHK